MGYLSVPACCTRVQDLRYSDGFSITPLPLASHGGVVFWVVSARQRSVLSKPLAWPLALVQPQGDTSPQPSGAWAATKCNSHVDVHGCGLHHSEPLYLEAQGSLFGDAAPFRGAAWCCTLPGSSLSRRRVATWDLRGKHVAMAALPQSEYQLNPHPLPKVPRRTAVLFSSALFYFWL